MSTSRPRIGVYICHCGANIAPKVDVAAVAEATHRLEDVEIAREYKFMCSHPGQGFIIDDIRRLALNRIVVASCSPRMHEPTFRRACENAGINPYHFQMANIREQVSWVTPDPAAATDKAKAQVAAAVARVAHHRPLFSREVPVTKAVLVVGGGIAGMQAAITAANAGYPVHLVERESSIGGHMAKFDKTFPSLDCAACIMTPKMVEVQQHPLIRLHTLSELTVLEGFVGNFKARILTKPRYVDAEVCTGCGACAEACPVHLNNRFDEGLSHRKAIYRSFPQAVPVAFSIDKRRPPPCGEACPAGVNVQGYIQLIAKGEHAAALRLIKEKIPLPGVLGRVCPHPCESRCRRQEVDGPLAIRRLKRFAADHGGTDALPQPVVEELPTRVAVVGSGPAGLSAAYYLRCKGHGVTLFESQQRLGGMLRYGIPDYRLPPDLLDREIDILLQAGITVRTGMALGRDFTLEELQQEGFQAVFMAIGAQRPLQIGLEGHDVAKGLIDALAFLKAANEGRPLPMGQRVVVIGGGNVALDAARVARRLGAAKVTVMYRRTLQEMPAYAEEIAEARAENIRFVLQAAPQKIRTRNGCVSGLVYQRTRPGPADESGRQRPLVIPESASLWHCDTIITAVGQRVDADWAGNEKRLHWSARDTLLVDPQTLQTAIPFVFAGGDMVSGPATVVEAVAAGRRAAESMHAYLNGLEPAAAHPTPQVRPANRADWVAIPERAEGARPAQALTAAATGRRQDFAGLSPKWTEAQARQEAGRCMNCGGCCECLECQRVCEVQAVRHDMTAQEETLEVGAVIVTTGFKPFDPTPLSQYGYGLYPEVYTSVQFERLNNATGPTAGQILTKNGLAPRRVAIIHCVGSRDTRHHNYCSRVCCMYSMKFAHLVREKSGAEVWEFYIDIRSPGKRYEEFYQRVQEEGVHLIRGKVAEVTDRVERLQDQGRLTVVAENTLTRRILRLPVDMVILSVALEPAEGAAGLGRAVGVASDADGWFNELHVKLAPVHTPKNGVFLAGCCQGPKDIPDTVAQATAAAGEAVALLAKGTVLTRAEISRIDPDCCSGCGICVAVCAYGAVSFDEGRGIAVVNEALCQGCGSCSAACPSSSAAVQQFTDPQVLAEIEALSA